MYQPEIAAVLDEGRCAPQTESHGDSGAKPRGPVQNFRSGPVHRSPSPRDAAARAALMASEAMAACCTLARRSAVAFHRGKCQSNTLSNCCCHSPGTRSMRHGLRGRMNPKCAQRLGDEAHRFQRAQAKPQIPIRRIPESPVQAARGEGGASTENRERYGNKILNEEALYE